MASVPLAALAIKSPEQPDLMGNYAKLVQLKSLMQQQQYQQQMQPLELQQRQGAIQLQNLQTQEAQRTLERNQALDSAFTDGAYTIGSDGVATINRQKLYDHLNASNAGSLIPDIETKLSTLDKTHADTAKALADTQKAQGETQAASADYLGSIGATIKASNYDPVVAATTLGHAAALGGPYAQQARDMLTHLQQNPQNIQQMTDEMIAASPKQIESQLKQSQIATAQAELPGKTAAAKEQVAKQQELEASGLTPSQFEAQAAGAKKKAEEAAAFPYQSRLVAVRQQVENAFWNQHDVIQKVEQNVIKPFSDQQQQFAQFNSALDQAAAGNSAAAQALLPKLVGISQPVGARRYNAQEAHQLASQGNIPQRFESTILKAINGEQWTPQMISDMRELSSAQNQVSVNSANAQIDNLNALHNLKGDNQIGHVSAPTTAPPPAPEGTVVNMPGGSKQVKKGGKWVPQQ